MVSTRRVAIVGAALSDIGRVDTKTPFELHYQAASRAIADAGLTKADIDGFASSGMGMLAPIEIAEYIGLRPTWVDGTGVGGSTWEFMVEHATAAILAGHADVVRELIPLDVWRTRSGLDVLRAVSAGELPRAPFAYLFGCALTDIEEGTVVPWLRERSGRRPFVQLDDGQRALLDTGSGLGLAIRESGPRDQETAASVRDIGGAWMSLRRRANFEK